MKKHKSIYSNKLLSLKDTKPFAEGGNRFCFIHPDDDSLCIKVVKPGSIASLRAKRSFLKNLRTDSYFDDNLSEYKAYQQPTILKGGDRIYDHIPRCYGWQNTDIGMGLVSDYYMQKSGMPSETLETYLHTNGFTDEIENKLNDLANYLRETQIMTKNIIPHNIIYAENEKLKIIDGLGFPSMFSIARISKLARRHYIERRIERMFLRAKWEASDKHKNWKETEKAGVL